MRVMPISNHEASRLVVGYHYLHRRPSISYAYGLETEEKTVGVVTFGIPASHHLRLGACPSHPESVIELNRLWVSDEMPRNTESWFLARALSTLPPMIVVSYADTGRGHMGIVYRAANFHYAGWTDMDKDTPRFDYETIVAPDTDSLFGVIKGKALHSRDAFRKADVSAVDLRHVPRTVKVKYWLPTGDARERKRLRRMCGWPILSWKDEPPPILHMKRARRAA